MTGAIRVEHVPEPTEDVHRLVDALEWELSSLYSEDQRHGFKVAAIFQRNIKFFIARKDGEPVGCGGVALYEGFAEAKRMYVRADLRGQGIADAVMARIEAEVRAAGHSILRLETGTHSHAAIRFYRRKGFVRCAAFEPFASRPPKSIVTSVFMEKRLAG
jgi:putative acetyltransferase